MKAPAYIIPATAGNDDLALIHKVLAKEHVSLKNNAKFALGIVTGNNNTHLLTTPSLRSEPIFRGKDIAPFCFLDPVFHIELDPGIYQQVAPLALYRQPKIAYRFIADKLVCALDLDGRLLLNSANLFIPLIKYPAETIVALLNSRLYTYLYRKMYHSKKVLRSHLESLPLPLLNAQQHHRFAKIHDAIVTGKNEQEELNQAVYSIFGLTSQEISLIAYPHLEKPQCIQTTQPLS